MVGCVQPIFNSYMYYASILSVMHVHVNQARSLTKPVCICQVNTCNEKQKHNVVEFDCGIVIVCSLTPTAPVRALVSRSQTLTGRVRESGYARL